MLALIYLLLAGSITFAMRLLELKLSVSRKVADSSYLNETPSVTLQLSNSAKALWQKRVC